MIIQPNKPTVIQLEQTCFACPSAWMGRTVCDKELYIRFRWGCLSAYLNDDVIYSESISDELDGVIDENSVIELLSHVLDFEELRSETHIVEDAWNFPPVHRIIKWDEE